MKLNTIFKTILLESEIDNIIKNKKEKLSKSEIGSETLFSKAFDYYVKEFIKNIPTPKKYVSKFLDLVNENYMGHDGLTLYDAFEQIYYYFNTWMTYKSQNLITKDILAQTYESLIDIVDEVKYNQKIRKAEKEIDNVYEDNRWLVIRVKSKEASCKYGSETKWCISSTKGDNRYHGYGYSENNFIYFIIDKKVKYDSNDVLYKMAVLINKKTGVIQVWNAADKLLEPEQVDVVARFIPEVFEAISKDTTILRNNLDEEFIKHSLYDTYSLKSIKYYERVKLKFNTDYSMLWMTYQKPNTNHWIEVDVDIKNNNISSTFYVSKIINDEKTGERYYNSTPTSIISIVSNEKITKSNFIKLIKNLFFDLFKTPEVKKFFTDNPEEYFSTVKLYKDIKTMGTKKVPQGAFVTAIKLLKEKGEQNITTIRRIVDPRLLASHNVKPLLRSLYSFGLIKIEKRGRNVMIVPTPKLVKTPLEKLI
jgi:hypothetical protein